MQIRVSVFLVGMLSLLSCQQHEKGEPDLTSHLDSLFKTAPEFSGVALVADQGKPLYFKSFGLKNYVTAEPMDTAAIFELASLSKQFTSMAIMMLKEDGLLSYDDLLEKYIPGLPYKGITIRHLLTHTSGLPDYQAVMDEHWDKTKVASNDDNIRYLKDYHPVKRFEPGEKYEYSNTGYMLLASVAEKASGRDFIEFCQDRIFNKLGMTSAGIRTWPQKKQLPSMAWGHLYVEEKKQYVAADSFAQFNYAIWLGNRKGPGRVSSKAQDLLKWDQALYTDRLVGQATLDEAFSKAKLNNGKEVGYGFGWEIRDDGNGGRIVHHSGDNPGYKTWIVRYTRPRKTLILLCNNAHEQSDVLFAEICKYLEHP